ncbi:MAG: hypothetical protein ACFFBP_15285 [Promethearchaeota archaeon]
MEKLIEVLNKLGLLETSDESKLINMKEFKNRLFYQKLIFLFNEKTNELKYSFNWYKRGPYSPDLTKDLYSIDELLKQKKKFIDLVIKENIDNNTMDKAIEYIQQLKSSFKEKFNREWTSIDLEILASLEYINKYTYSNCRDSKDNTIKEFKERKPKLNNEPISDYWDLLESLDTI